MEFSKKFFILIIATVFIYFFLIDLFTKTSFKENLKSQLKMIMGRVVSHSLVNLIENKANTVAGFLAIMSVTFLDSLPVMKK